MVEQELEEGSPMTPRVKQKKGEPFMETQSSLDDRWDKNVTADKRVSNLGDIGLNPHSAWVPLGQSHTHSACPISQGCYDDQMEERRIYAALGSHLGRKVEFYWNNIWRLWEVPGCP